MARQRSQDSPELTKPPRGDERGDELESFEHRLEWFLSHIDLSGAGSDERLQRAVAHAVRLEREPPQMRLEPRGAPPKAGAVAVVGGEAGRARVRKHANPRPQSSIGFVGRALHVAFDDAALPEGVDVQVGLGDKLVAHVVPSSIRMFRFDDETNAWVLVPRSGIGRDFTYAWVRSHRPGLYAAVGLPADPVLFLGILLLAALHMQRDAASRTRGVQRLVGAVAQLVFEGGNVAHLAGEPSVDAIGSAAFRETLGQLDIPERGLPEWDILDDIRPQTWRIPRRGWPWPPISWPPGVHWPPVPPIFWPLLPTDWTSAGPRNVNGRVKSLAIHPATENIVWAGAANGGVWKSVNGGATWLPMMSEELSLAIGAIAIAPSNGHIVYAGTGEDTPGWAPSWGGAGVYKTDDSGATWTLCAPIASTRCTRVLVHPNDPDVVYVAGNNGLHKSTDGGASWSNVRNDHVSDAVLDPDNPFRIFAGVWNIGVFLTTNGGASWTQLSNGIPTGSAADWIKLAMGRHGGNGTDLVLAKMGTDSGSIYRTTDGGTSWGLVASNVQPASYNEWTNLVAVDPYDETRILAGGIGISRSTDGRTFTEVHQTHSDHHAIVYSPEDSSVVYMATDGGVYRSTDGGGTWELRSYDLVATQMYSIGVSQTPTLLLGGATQDQGIIRNLGSGDWTGTGAGNEGGFFVVDPNNDQNVYVTPWDGGLRRSTDGGMTWTTIQAGITEGGMDVHPDGIAVEPGDSSDLLCVAGSQIFRSVDQGGTWSSVFTAPDTTTRVAFADSLPDTCYVATVGGSVFRSTSGGEPASWSKPYATADAPPATIPFFGGGIAAIAVSHTDPNRLFIGYSGFGLPSAHVWRSTDGGAHWTNASGTGAATLPDIPVNALVVHHLNSDIVYAATDIGVFRTSDGGVTWQTFSEGLPRTFVSGLVLRRSSRMLYASTMGRGAFCRGVWFA